MTVLSAQFQPTHTPIPGLSILDRRASGDQRGFFERLYCAAELQAIGHPGIVVQVNRSMTCQRGVIRGMHFQHPPHGEWKVITCLRGRVHDVIVDIRRGSPTFLTWQDVELGEGLRRSIVVPPGCAHGFQTLTEDCEMLYLHSAFYAPESEGGLRADDPRLGISWPLPCSQRSERDGRHPLITVEFQGLES